MTSEKNTSPTQRLEFLKIMKLTTYWSAEEASTAYEVMDALKEAVWEVYGDKIVAKHRAMRDEMQKTGDQYPLPFDAPADF